MAPHGGVVIIYISEVMMGHKIEQSLVNSKTDFFYYAFRNILLVSIPLVIISAFILGFNMSHSSARISSSDSLAISVPSSCTLSSSVDEAHSASIVNGRYEEGIGTTTLSTFCNDKNGYSVYAIGDSLNSEGNNTLVGSNDNNINSGTATSGDTSQWAMKLALKAGDTSTTPPTIISPFNNYTTVPANWTKVATISASTTDMEKGSNFTTTYATYISPTQAAGTYLGQVKYLLTHPSAAEPDTSYFIMQEVANWKNDLDEEESVQAIDIRDGKIYWVTKLKDGNIWMTQNLDFDISTNTTLNSQTTDLNVSYSSSIGQYEEYNNGYAKNNGTIYWTPANTATTINFTGTTVTNWINSNTKPYSANKTDSTETGHASLGNYYNWTTAIASNDSSSLTQDTKSDITKNPKNSICPKGWRLPTISSVTDKDEFRKLNNAYNNGSTSSDASLITSPLWFVRSGNVNNIDLFSFGARGDYSSSTVNSSLTYTLRFSSDGVNPANNSGKDLGFSVRCVAR